MVGSDDGVVVGRRCHPGAVTLASVTERLAGVAGGHSNSEKRLTELTRLVERVTEICDDVGWEARCSKQRQVHHCLAKYAALVEKLSDARRLLDEATEILGEYVSIVTDTLPVDDAATVMFLLASNQKAVAEKVLSGGWDNDVGASDERSA